MVDQSIIPPPAKFIKFEDLPIDFIEEKIAEFSAKIKDIYDVGNVILLEVHPAFLLLNNRNNELLGFNVAKTKILEEKLHLCFELSLKYLNGCHVIRSSKIVLGNANHKWGIHNLHYQYEYYTKYFLKCVDIITQVVSPLEEERLLSNTLIEFENEIRRRYFHLFYTKIIDSNILREQGTSQPHRITCYDRSSLILDYQNKRLLHVEIDSFKTEVEQYCEIFLKIINGRVLFYSIINGNPIYIRTISNAGNVEYSDIPTLFNIKKYTSDEFSIQVNDQYLSARLNNSIGLSKNNKAWEIFKLKH